MKTHYERLATRLKYRDRVQTIIERLAGDGNKVWKALPYMLGDAVDRRLSIPRLSVEVIAATHLEIQKYVLDHQKEPYSFSELLTSPDYFELGKYLAGICSGPEASATLQVNYQWICHERAGLRVYDVSPGLAEQLRYTEIRGIRAEDIRLPYENVYIQVPPEAGLKIWNNNTAWHRVVGAYITEERSMSADDEYTIMRPAGNIRGWRVLLVGEDKSTDPDNPGDDALTFYRVLYRDGTTLPDVIKQAHKEMHQANEMAESCWNNMMGIDWENQFRWCMNVVLYATWQEPGEHWMANKEARQLWSRIQKTNSPKKRKALSKRFQTISKQRRIRLGHNIVVDRRKTASDAEKSGTGKPGTTQNVFRIKTRVSGHWKHVPHGPKRSLRRYQWIEPHWRNKDGLEPVQEPKHELR
jgi:hypothetical protein